MSYLGNQPNSVAFLTDQFSGNGSTVAFTMSVAPAAPSSLLVNISGVTQDPTTYAIAGTTLTFSSAPPNGTGNISVRYLGIPASSVATTAYRTVSEFVATAGQTSFSVPSYTVGYIDVFRNGVRLGAADYTATSGTTVVLAVAANLNDLIVTESFYVSSVLNAIPATGGAVGTTNIANQAVTQSKLAANVAGNGPAFSAYRATGAGTQSVSSDVWTKFAASSEEFDTNSNYDTSTYRFTPTVAGYYQINLTLYMQPSSGTFTVATCAIYKNGGEFKRGNDMRSAAALTTVLASGVIYFNGTTDYVEPYGYISGTTPSFGTGIGFTFSGSLVRAA